MTTSPPTAAPTHTSADTHAIATGWTLAFGEIRHQRLAPVRHKFRYRGFFLGGSVQHLDGRPHGNWQFGINRRALISFNEADHGDGRPVSEWLGEMLANAGVRNIATIAFEGFPRVLGYAFKPVSFWHCHRTDGSLAAIVAEVNNTFGERHYYLLASPTGAPLRPGQLLQAPKQFYVSPFLAVHGGYRFRFNRRGAQSVSRIEHFDDTGVLLVTSMSGTHQPVSARALARALLSYPLFTLGIIVRIHWQALQLALRRVQLHPRPDHQANTVTAGHPPSSDPS